MSFKEEFKDQQGEYRIPHLFIPRELYQYFLEGSLSSKEILFLGVIDSLSKNRTRKCTASNQWFSRLFGVSEWTISNWISSLKKKGFLKVRKGKGRGREIEINSTKKSSNGDCEPWEKSQGCSPVNHGKNPKDYYSSNNKINNNIATDVGDRVCGKSLFGKINQKDSPFRKFSSKLHQVVKNKGLLRRSIKINSWDSEFKKLIELDGIPIEEVEFVLNWYIKNITSTYIPKAYSPKTFRSKFDRIVNAMHEKGIHFQEREFPEMEDCLENLSHLKIENLKAKVYKSLVLIDDFRTRIKKLEDKYGLMDMLYKEDVRTKEGCFCMISSYVEPLVSSPEQLIPYHIKKTKRELTESDLFELSSKEVPGGYEKDLELFFEEL